MILVCIIPYLLCIYISCSICFSLRLCICTHFYKSLIRDASLCEMLLVSTTSYIVHQEHISCTNRTCLFSKTVDIYCRSDRYWHTVSIESNNLCSCTTKVFFSTCMVYSYCFINSQSSTQSTNFIKLVR